MTSSEDSFPQVNLGVMESSMDEPAWMYFKPSYDEKVNCSHIVVLHEEDFRFFSHQCNKSPTVSVVSIRTPTSSKPQPDVTEKRLILSNKHIMQ